MSGANPFNLQDIFQDSASGLSTGQVDYGLGPAANQWLFYGTETNRETSPTADLGNGTTRRFQNTSSFDYGASGNQLMKRFINMSNNPQKFAQMQKQLYAAGFYHGSKPVPGAFTTADQTAMANAIKDYASVSNSFTGPHAPKTLSEYIDAVAGFNQAFGSGSGGGSGRAPLTISYTDPAELHAGLQQAAQNALGRNLNPDELNEFTKVFHSKEAAAQTSAYNGGNSTNPEMTGEAQQFVDQHNSQEEGERLQATFLDQLNSTLGIK
jgi:hypothetical protein